MKNDDEPFEQRLGRQPLREIPTAWREQILAQIKVTTKPDAQTTPLPRVSEDAVALLTGWRMLLGRLPLAWSALAALWLVLLGANLLLAGPARRESAQATTPNPISALAVLNLQSAEPDSWDVQLAPAPQPAPANTPPAEPARPRGDRGRGSDFGVGVPDALFDRIA